MPLSIQCVDDFIEAHESRRVQILPLPPDPGVRMLRPDCCQFANVTHVMHAHLDRGRAQPKERLPAFAEPSRPQGSGIERCDDERIIGKPGFL